MARNFLALGSGEALARIVAFGATVYIARVLGASLYGVIGFATAIILYLTRIADCGIYFFGLGVREIAADRNRIHTVAPSVMSARLLVSASLTLLVGVGAFFLPQPEGSVLAIYGFTLLMVGGGTNWIHYGLERTHVAAIARTGGELLMVALVLAMVREAGDVVRVPLAQFAGDSLAAVILALWLLRRGFPLPMRLDWSVVLPLFARSWRLVASALLGLMIYNSDLVFLRIFRDSAAVGYYAAAYALISFGLNLGTAYGVSLLPTLSRLTAPEQRGLYQTAIAHVFAIVCPTAVGGFLLAPKIIPFVFGSAYAASVAPLDVLVWSLPASVGLSVANVSLMARKREDRVLRITLVATALNLALNLLLIPPYGLMGAAVSTLVTEVTQLGMGLFFAREAGFPLLGVGRLWKVATATGAMAAVLLSLRSLPLWSAFILGTATYAAALWILGGLVLQGRRLPALDV